MGADRSTTLLSVREDFQFEWALSKWLAIEGQLLGGVAAATDLQGSYRRGVSYAYGGHAGLLARIIELGPLYLSTFLEGEIVAFESIVPARVRDSVQTDDGVIEIPRGSLSRPGTFYGLDVGLAAALGFLPWFGMQLSAAVGVRGFAFERATDEVEGTVILGTAASFDLGVVGAGLTLLLGARLFQDFGDTDPVLPALELPGSTRGSFEVGGYYSGRSEVDIGLALTYQVGGGDVAFTAIPVINYFWW